jgi:hypothetical protein
LTDGQQPAAVAVPSADTSVTGRVGNPLSSYNDPGLATVANLLTQAAPNHKGNPGLSVQLPGHLSASSYAWAVLLASSYEERQTRHPLPTSDDLLHAQAIIDLAGALVCVPVWHALSVDLSKPKVATGGVPQVQAGKP